MRKILLSLFLAFILSPIFAGEGMWLPLLLKSLNEAEMQSLGMKITAEDIYSVNKGSLKDAIVHFGGFCTAEVISDQGLLLTNHHCGYGQIQSHSSVEDNLLKNGFWADGKQEELSNPGLFARFIQSIEDVSDKVLSGVSEKLSEKDRQSIVDKNIKALQNSMETGPFEEIMIRPFFNGNQYFLFKTISYPDVRLVGTPPESIGKFGSDTDNWVWPRHTGDFALFRIYAGPNNEPAEYDPANKPYNPKHFLPISLDGVQQGDFTMVFGFPGRTNSYLPSYAVEQLVDKLNPAKISIRDEALGIIDKYMRADEGVRLQYASKFARVANYWKKWIGESQGLQSTGAIAKKKKYEKEFNTALNAHPDKKMLYGDLLGQFEEKYKAIKDLAYTRDYYSEYTRNVEIIRVMNYLRRLAKSQQSGDLEGYEAFKGRLIDRFFSNFYKNYRPTIDEEVFGALTEMYFTNVDKNYISEKAQATVASNYYGYANLAKNFFAETVAADEKKLMGILSMPPAKAVEAFTGDPLYKFVDRLAEHHNETVSKPLNAIQREINELQRKYMKAQMEVFPDKRFYPDANSTMRITYGNVNGYEPRDAVAYKSQTFLGGVIEKYKPGDYEFDVPEKLRQLYEDRDYGQYAQDGKMPICFLGTNHTTGGNSGSPAIDAYGNLVGLNFDRVWEGTMSDINYDPSICRNIMVDTRYILFIVDKFAGASHLIDEMKLVWPKTLPESKPAKPKLDAKSLKKRKKSKIGTNSKIIRPAPSKQ
ncbi:MAG: S46 family peptidase [Saprospiraceae bacterium]|nr:S46 family peptidase [Saprospiraceae bacterium]